MRRLKLERYINYYLEDFYLISICAKGIHRYFNVKSRTIDLVTSKTRMKESYKCQLKGVKLIIGGEQIGILIGLHSYLYEHYGADSFYIAIDEYVA